MKEQKIFALLRQNDQGIVYGITYVDNKTQCVFNGSDLGKGYSAAAVQRRLSGKQHRRPGAGQKYKPQQRPAHSLVDSTANPSVILDALLATKEQTENVPASLLNKKRKKKRRRDNNI